ncbi:MAG: hypothetical protein RDU20_18295 [Desulfomonilaceae bacterium]|nr:hypothetical protein [Desulfomonilaceae bacterium]
MFRITLGSVRVLLGAAAAGLAFWGAWKLGTYLAEKAVGERYSHVGETGAQPEEARTAVPVWQRKFSPISSG